MATEPRADRMELVADGADHVGTLLGSYFTGGLLDDEEFAVEEHLVHCGLCLEDYGKLGPVFSLLDSTGPAAMQHDESLQGESRAV